MSAGAKDLLNSQKSIRDRSAAFSPKEFYIQVSCPGPGHKKGDAASGITFFVHLYGPYDLLFYFSLILAKGL
jgi:hypothetical protein